MNKLITFIASLLTITLILDEVFIDKSKEDFEMRMSKWEDIQEGYYSKYLSGMTY